MKNITKMIAVAAITGLVATSAAFAGTGKSIKEEVIVVEPTKAWGAALSTGWDSLYMFRGVNVLPNDNGYGSSLYWTNLSLSYNITPDDVISVGGWMAFGLTDTNYKEFDLSVAYTHSWGNLSLTLGYIFYDIISSNRSYAYSHELNAGLAYTFDLGFMSLTPSLTYFFNLGPNTGSGGYFDTASSYLLAKLVGDIPVIGEAVSLAPWIALGTNFNMNSREYADGSVSPFVGTNNLELGLAIPWAINDIITVSVYGAYSYQWYGLVGTDPSTFWGGANVTFSF